MHFKAIFSNLLRFFVKNPSRPAQSAHTDPIPFNSLLIVGHTAQECHKNMLKKAEHKKTHERKRKCGNKYEMEVTALLMYINSGQLSVYMFFGQEIKKEKNRL